MGILAGFGRALLRDYDACGPKSTVKSSWQLPGSLVKYLIPDDPLGLPAAIDNPPSASQPIVRLVLKDRSSAMTVPHLTSEWTGQIHPGGYLPPTCYTSAAAVVSPQDQPSGKPTPLCHTAVSTFTLSGTSFDLSHTEYTVPDDGLEDWWASGPSARAF
jgi:hypothetical protein